jgi:hypothetical protein
MSRRDLRTQPGPKDFRPWNMSKKMTRPEESQRGPFGTKIRTPVHIFDSTPPTKFEDEDDDEYENDKPYR